MADKEVVLKRDREPDVVGKDAALGYLEAEKTRTMKVLSDLQLFGPLARMLSLRFAEKAIRADKDYDLGARSITPSDAMVYLKEGQLP